MSDTVKIIIDDVEYEVPAGTNLVDAAKRYADNDIPVFCYHPKMEPAGMCRMCLVKMGMIQRNRETGEVELDDKGQPIVRWFPKLQTACTQVVQDGMVIQTQGQEVKDARTNVVEFLLTSHPLDCPICDKGGECPLQNLTMGYGPGTSRMQFEDKQHLDKHVPLGDLIFLDEERCIQCARCIRFQAEVVGDDVLAFHERGRRLQIITNSDPGFDTYFSGNTTDICPVGALTTADFRFGARPWELTEVPSIDPYGPAGSNISLSTRLDRAYNGRAIIKRVMPRQNEWVNEIWIHDKTRFGHHFTRAENRLQAPMVRNSSGQLTETVWSEALKRVAELLQAADGDVAAIAGSGMSNEDLWTLHKLVKSVGGERLGAWPPNFGGLEHVAQVGVGTGTNLSDLDAGDAILVIASDLEEEEPIWRLRVKQAQDRGAYLVVANARGTRLEEFAVEPYRLTQKMKPVQGDAIRYAPGMAAHTMANLKKEHPKIAEKLAKAENLVIFAGAEGLTLEGSKALLQAAANFLIETDHVGRPNNGLIAVTNGPNAMGQYYLGFTPEATQDIAANPPKVLIVAQADIMYDDPTVAEWIDQVETVIQLGLFADDLSAKAAAVLPIQSFAERDGTYTSGERRAQRFYTAQGPVGEALPAWQILQRVGEVLGQGRPKLSAAAVMKDITENVAAFAGCRYKALAHVEPQFPLVGGDDLYYGGTAYANKGGLGVQIAATAERSKPKTGKVELPDVPKAGKGELLILPTVKLYNREKPFAASTLVHPRVLVPYVALNPADAKRLGVGHSDVVEVTVGATAVRVRAVVDDATPEGTALLPRHLADVATPLSLQAGKLHKVAAAEKVGV